MNYFFPQHAARKQSGVVYPFSSSPNQHVFSQHIRTAKQSKSESKMSKDVGGWRFPPATPQLAYRHPVFSVSPELSQRHPESGAGSAHPSETAPRLLKHSKAHLQKPGKTSWNEPQSYLSCQTVSVETHTHTGPICLFWTSYRGDSTC